MYRALLHGVMALGVLNFVMFLIGASVVGGSAAYVREGHYFVRNLGTFSEGAGTKINEVSKANFDYVTLHQDSLLITGLLFAAAALLLMADDYRRRHTNP